MLNSCPLSKLEALLRATYIQFSLPAVCLRRGVLLLFAITLLVLPLSSAAAQTTPGTISMEITPAFEGHFKYGEWLPLWVELENNGADVNGELQVSIAGNNSLQYVVPVELPAGARKRLPVYVLPNNFSRQLLVSLVSGGETLAAQKIQIQPHPNLVFMTGIASPQRDALALIEAAEFPGMRRERVTVDVPLALLPERFEGLRSLDMLILNDVDTSTLTPDQLRALESWVAQGGRLVIGGGVGAQKTVSGLPPALFPAEIGGVSRMDFVSGLVNFVGGETPITVPGPFLVTDLQTRSGEQLDLSGGRQLASQGGRPLLVEWRVGNGYVDFSALDLSGAPFNAWSGTAPFWSALLGSWAAYPDWLPADVSARQQFASNMPYTLSNLPMLDLPSARSLALLLGVYILLVGPINYLVLRRRKKLHLAWITIPAITLIFSIAAFGMGYLLHGTDIFLNKIAVIYLQPSGSARVDTFVGLFSPAQRAYEVQVRGGGLLSPLSPYYDPWTSFETPGGQTTGGVLTLVQGDPGYMRGLSVGQWSLQSFWTEGQPMEFGQLDADIRLTDSGLEGTLRNNSERTLADAAILMGNQFARLGDLQPGAEASFSLDLSSLSQPNFSSPLSYSLFQDQLSTQPGPQQRQADVRRSIVEALFERYSPGFASFQTAASPWMQPVLIGWLNEAPPEVNVAGVAPAQQTTAIAVLPLTYNLPESGPVNLPVGLIPGRLVNSASGTCGPVGGATVYLTGNEAIFEYSLPSEARKIQVDNLKLGLWTDSGGLMVEMPGAEFYDWETQEWVPVLGLNQGINLVPDAGHLVSTDGLVRLKLTPAPTGVQYCFYTGLGLEGHQ